MPTESVSIADSGGPRVRTHFSNALPNHVCVGVYGALLQAGWEAVPGATKARFRVSVPTPPIVPDPPDPPIPENEKPVAPLRSIAYSRIPGDDLTLTYTLYDPYREQALTGAGLVPVAGNENGQTAASNLAAAIAGGVNGTIVGVSSSEGWWEIEVPDEGLEWNGTEVGGELFVTGKTAYMYGMAVCSVETPTGAGSKLRSGQPVPDAWIEVWIGLPYRRGVPTFEFTASTGGERPTRTLPEQKSLALTMANTSYTIIACPYQFFVFVGGRPATYGAGLYGQLMASVPQLEQEEHGVDYAAVVAGWGTFRSGLVWSWNSASAANSGFTRNIGAADSGKQPLLHSIKYNPALTDALKGEAIAQSAYLALWNGVWSTVRIVGRLWDALVIHAQYDLVIDPEQYAVGNRARYADLMYECVGVQNDAGGGVTGSLWIAYDVAPVD